MRTVPPSPRTADATLPRGVAACLVAVLGAGLAAGLGACSAQPEASAGAAAATGSPSGPPAPTTAASPGSPESAAGPAGTEPTEPAAGAGPTDSTEVTPTASPSADVPEALPPAGPGLRGRLLAPEQVPSLRGDTGWTAAEVSRVEPDPITVCHKTPLSSLGAQQAVVRTFADAANPSAYAAHLVARFPDRATARRVESVLLSWHDDCAGRIAAGAAGEDAPVGPIRSAGAGGQWYLTRGGSGPGSVEVTALAAHATRLSVLVVGDARPGPGSVPDEASVDRAVQAAVELAAQLLR